MKRRVFQSLIIAWLGLTLSQCGGGTDQAVPPNQSQVDEFIQEVVQEFTSFAFGFEFIGNCEQFDQALAETPASTPCLDGGSLGLIISNQECDEGPPLKASFQILITSQECTLNGMTVSGGLTAQIAISGDTVSATLNATDLVAFGVEYHFSEVMISVDGEGNLTCSGTMQVDQSTCSMTADCSSCTVEG